MQEEKHVLNPRRQTVHETFMILQAVQEGSGMGHGLADERRGEKSEEKRMMAEARS